MKNTLLFLAILITLSRCSKETCSNDVDYGSFELSNAAKEFNPYLSQNRTIIFKDSLLNEYRFIILDNELRTSNSNSVPGPCSEDSSKTVHYKSKSNYFRIKLIGVEINTEFQIWLNPIPQPNQNGESGEELIVQNGSDIYNCLYHRINQKDRNGNFISHEDNSFVLDSLTVLNKTFFQVIVNNPAGLNKKPKYRVGYNKNYGLVWLEDTSLPKTYVYDRIEN